MTKPLTFGPWPIGMDTVSPETGLPDGAARDAVNVDFDRTGGASRRNGRTLGVALPAHSLWTSATGQGYGVVNGDVARISCVGGVLAVTTLYTLAHPGPVSFDDHLDGVLFVGARDLCQIDHDGVVRSLGVENPASPTVTASPYGGLEAGRYAIGMTYLRGLEESGLSYGQFAEVDFGGGLQLTIPQPHDPDIDGVRLYRTPPNGDVYYRAADVPIGMTSYLLGNVALGRKADTQFLERLPYGHIVRSWKGRTLLAANNVLVFSDALRYGLADRRYNWVQFTSRIRVLQPVEGGVFVGNEQGVYFLRGTNPDEWQMELTGGKPPIAGTGMAIEAAELGVDIGSKRVALWLARNGFVIGGADGAVIETQKSRIRIPSAQWNGTGSIVVTDRKVVASIG